MIDHESPHTPSPGERGTGSGLLKIITLTTVLCLLSVRLPGGDGPVDPPSPQKFDPPPAPFPIGPPPDLDRKLSPAEEAELKALQKQFDVLPELEMLPFDDGEMPPSTKPERPPVGSPVLDRAAALAKENLRHRRTPGYLERDILLSSGPEGTALDVRLRVGIGLYDKTEQPLDLGLRRGFFLVQHGEDRYLTRAGHFHIGPDRKVGLQLGDVFYPVVPTVRVPETARFAKWNDNGELQGQTDEMQNTEMETTFGRIGVYDVLDPSRLNFANGVLLQPTPASGSPFQVKVEGDYRVSPRHLLLSNVHVERNEDLLERIGE